MYQTKRAKNGSSGKCFRKYREPSNKKVQKINSPTVESNIFSINEDSKVYINSPKLWALNWAHTI